MLYTILIGLIAGVCAKLLMPGKDPSGFIITILLGIGGAFLATFLGKTVGWYESGEAAGFIGAIVGAVLILWIYRKTVKKKASSAA
ncbi:MAG: GlsB/YeaQ/YmgE family stress response membrane protein [bacterium]